MRCRLCDGAVVEFISFGRQPMANAFLEPAQFDREFFYRLAVGMCQSCTLVQLIDEVPNERMFHKEYPYHSSGSMTMRAHFGDMARHLIAAELTGPDPLIVEIGANDGAMLHTVAEAGLRHVGVEPCDNLARLAERRGVTVVDSYFGAETGAAVAAEHGPADVIYSANTFSHISDVHSVMRGIDALLSKTGIFVVEDPYFLDIVSLTSFDQVYDEHIYFFTARSISALAEAYGFELVDAQRLAVHGGEVRYTIARSGVRPPEPSVQELISLEQRRGLTSEATLRQFAANAARHRDELRTLLQDLNARGQRVAGYGATGKSATVLNYCGIGPDLLEFVCDSTPAKQGRYTPGSHIPVRAPAHFATDRPDYALLLAWNHGPEITANESWFGRAGGRWIRYVPEVGLL
jgi:methylation protein EvaC